MSGGIRWGVRARLVAAFVGVALLGAYLTTIYSGLSLDSHIAASARTRLQHSATHFGDVAAVLSNGGGWTAQNVDTLHHLAEIDFLAVALTARGGKVVFAHPPSGPVQAGATASAPVIAGGHQIGRVTVSPSDGRLLSPEEVQLRGELTRMAIVGGVISAAIALAVALYLAFTLSSPLRRIRAGAEAMRAGDLDTRVPESGDAEIRAVAEALNGLAETLQQEEALRKASVADLAHELRTPVMGLLGRIEAAQDGVLEAGGANLEAMHDEALRLQRLLDDLSALAEAEKPGLLLSHEPVSLPDLVAREVALERDKFAARDVSLDTDLRPADVTGDERRLGQVVVNLLSNALRYTDAGGTVLVSVHSEGEEAVLNVADTGIGIAKEDLPLVFTRFWRGEKSRSRHTGGAGIGLAIVKALVEAHGGRVAVTSSPGAGSTFTVRLPSAAAIAGEAGGAPAVRTTAQA